MKHKHAEVIKAWADGAIVEEYRPNLNQWVEPQPYPIWDARFSYRIKPEPVEQYKPNIRISQLEIKLQACRKLIKEQDEKIVELATKLAYANKSIEIANAEEEPQFFYVYNHINTNNTWMSPTLMQDTSDWDYIGKVEVIK
jgi:hypothetical protein